MNVDEMTKEEAKRVNRAFQRLCRQLDRFETICAENNSPFRAVHFVNRPDTEFSDCRVIWRRGKRKTSK